MSLTVFITVIYNKHVGLKYNDIKFALGKGIYLKTLTSYTYTQINIFPLTK